MKLLNLIIILWSLVISHSIPIPNPGLIPTSGSHSPIIPPSTEHASNAFHTLPPKPSVSIKDRLKNFWNYIKNFFKSRFGKPQQELHTLKSPITEKFALSIRNHDIEKLVSNAALLGHQESQEFLLLNREMLHKIPGILIALKHLEQTIYFIKHPEIIQSMLQNSNLKQLIVTKDADLGLQLAAIGNDVPLINEIMTPVNGKPIELDFINALKTSALYKNSEAFQSIISHNEILDIIERGSAASEIFAECRTLATIKAIYEPMKNHIPSQSVEQKFSDVFNEYSLSTNSPALRNENMEIMKYLRDTEGAESFISHRFSVDDLFRAPAVTKEPSADNSYFSYFWPFTERKSSSGKDLKTAAVPKPENEVQKHFPHSEGNIVDKGTNAIKKDERTFYQWILGHKATENAIKKDERTFYQWIFGHKATESPNSKVEPISGNNHFKTSIDDSQNLNPITTGRRINSEKSELSSKESVENWARGPKTPKAVAKLLEIQGPLSIETIQSIQDTEILFIIDKAIFTDNLIFHEFIQNNLKSLHKIPDIIQSLLMLEFKLKVVKHPETIEKILQNADLRAMILKKNDLALQLASISGDALIITNLISNSKILSLDFFGAIENAIQYENSEIIKIMLSNEAILSYAKHTADRFFNLAKSLDTIKAVSKPLNPYISSASQEQKISDAFNEYSRAENSPAVRKDNIEILKYLKSRSFYDSDYTPKKSPNSLSIFENAFKTESSTLRISIPGSTFNSFTDAEKSTTNILSDSDLGPPVLGPEHNLEKHYESSNSRMKDDFRALSRIKSQSDSGTHDTPNSRNQDAGEVFPSRFPIAKTQSENDIPSFFNSREYLIGSRSQISRETFNNEKDSVTPKALENDEFFTPVSSPRKPLSE